MGYSRNVAAGERGSSTRARDGARARLAAAVLLVAGSVACFDPETDPLDSDPNAIPLALMLSYSGTSAATSINSERAVQLAVERINQTDGLGGRRIRLVVRDIQSDSQRTERVYRELAGARIAAFIGLDSPDVVTHFVQGHRQSTLFLPGVAITARDTFYGTDSWFTFAPHTWTLACAFRRRLAADGVTRPLILHGPDAFHSELAFALGRTLGAPDRALVIPSQGELSVAQVEAVLQRNSDALLLLAFPEAAAPVLSDLSLRTGRGIRWYLSPTLDTPRFYEVVPFGALQGAQVAKPGRAMEAESFAALFQQRWGEPPLDEAYGFYDAVAIAALALQTALVQTGALPTVETLGRFVRPVSGPPGVPITWNAIDQGLALIREGQDIDYQGLSGQLDFDDRGSPHRLLVQWWRIGEEGRTNEGPPLVTAGAWGSCPEQ